MKLLATVVLLVGTAFSQSSTITGTVSITGTVTMAPENTGCGAGYLFSKEIQLARAIGSDLTDYPYTINGAVAPSSVQTAMLLTGSGGSVQHTTTNSIGRTVPADVKFCDSAANGTALKYEIDGYDGTVAGKWTAYPQKPTLSASSTGSVWIFVGNTSVSISQQDLSMWTDISCVAIWHLSDAKDSCPTNGYDGTINGTVTDSTDPIGGSKTFAGVTSSNITFDGTTNLANMGSALSVTGWIRATSFSNRYPIMIALHSNDGAPLTFGLSDDCPNYCGVLMGDNANWARIHTSTTPHVGAYTYAGFSYNGSGSSTSGNFNIVQNGAVASLSSAGAFGAITNENKIGSSSSSGNSLVGIEDEVRVFSGQTSTNWMKTDWLTQAGQLSSTTGLTWKATPYLVVETPPSTPYIRQYVACNTDEFAGLCPLNFPVVSGNLVIVGMTVTDEGSTLCSHPPTDTLGSTFTLRSSDSYTGTIHSYQTCIFSAPMASSAVNTITLPTANVGGPNVAAVVLEVPNATTTGMVVANAGNSAGPPSAMSATSPAADSFLVCLTRNSDPGGPPPTLPTTTEGYSAIQSAYNGGDHPSSAYLAYGVVGSGSKSCTLQTSGNGAVMAIFPKN
jgi:hypothetical protein